MTRPNAYYVRTILSYNKRTGIWIWKKPAAKRLKPGDQAGANSHGYIRIKIHGQQYAAHVLAYLYVKGRWPSYSMDHRNGDPGDNRWNNLRLASHHMNMSNQKLRITNTVGLKGVTRERGYYVAQIQCRGKHMYLGSFKTPKEAHSAYMKKARQLFGQFARPK